MRGGLTELRKIATVADTWGMTIAPHLFPELNVQLLASIPNGLWIEDMGLAEDLCVDPVPVVNGTITAPERPGHGLAFKPEILRDYAVGAASRWCGQLVRPRHDRHGADRIGRRAIDDLGADGEVDDGVVRRIDHAIDARCLKEDAGLLGEDFLF